MSTAVGKESLSFFLKTGSFAFGIGYGTVRTVMLQRKENRIQKRYDVAAKAAAAKEAKRLAAAPPSTAEPGFFDELFTEEPSK